MAKKSKKLDIEKILQIAFIALIIVVVILFVLKKNVQAPDKEMGAFDITVEKVSEIDEDHAMDIDDYLYGRHQGYYSNYVVFDPVPEAERQSLSVFNECYFLVGEHFLNLCERLGFIFVCLVHKIIAPFIFR